MVGFAYVAQQRCYPGGIPWAFQALVHYVTAAQSQGEQVPEWLQQLCLDERERPRGRFTIDDLQRAVVALGFGEDNSLRVLYDDADDQFVMGAVEHALSTPNATGLSTREIGDAFRIIAYSRGKRDMVEQYEKMAARGWMSVDEAYRVLGASKDVDDGMLIMAAMMQIGDTPSDTDKIKEAISFIARARESFRLTKFLEIGQDRMSLLLDRLSSFY
jgi:ubiquitin carboxyl-terminal hydrolase 25/28